MICYYRNAHSHWLRFIRAELGPKWVEIWEIMIREREGKAHARGECVKEKDYDDDDNDVVGRHEKPDPT